MQTKSMTETDEVESAVIDKQIEAADKQTGKERVSVNRGVCSVILADVLEAAR